MDKERISLSIHEKDDGVTIASLEKATNPVAILNDEFLDHLYVEYQEAKQAMSALSGAEASSVQILCERLERFIKPYAIVRNKYFDGLGPARKFVAAEQELEKLKKELEELNGK
ncbi:MAG: hypothetical protein AAF431_00740 [Pseudomonadota bacterium]